MFHETKCKGFVIRTQWTYCTGVTETYLDGGGEGDPVPALQGPRAGD